jgi:hypothetical protein
LVDAEPVDSSISWIFQRYDFAKYGAKVCHLHCIDLVSTGSSTLKHKETSPCITQVVPSSNDDEPTFQLDLKFDEDGLLLLEGDDCTVSVFLEQEAMNDMAIDASVPHKNTSDEQQVTLKVEVESTTDDSSSNPSLEKHQVLFGDDDEVGGFPEKVYMYANLFSKAENKSVKKGLGKLVAIKVRK